MLQESTDGVAPEMKRDQHRPEDPSANVHSCVTSSADLLRNTRSFGHSDGSLDSECLPSDGNSHAFGCN